MISNKRLDEQLMAHSEKLYKLACDVGKLEAERDALQARLNEAVGRIKDILIQDDGQAYKEAEKFLDKLEGEG